MTDDMYPLRPMTNEDEKQVKKRLKERKEKLKNKAGKIWKGYRF